MSIVTESPWQCLGCWYCYSQFLQWLGTGNDLREPVLRDDDTEDQSIARSLARFFTSSLLPLAELPAKREREPHALESTLSFQLLNR